MNRLADFVYSVATTGHRQKRLLVAGGILLWYGGVILLLVISPLIDGRLVNGFVIPSVFRYSMATILIVAGMPLVGTSISHCFQSKGTPVPFKPPPTLMTGGIYGIIRNPMHLGWTLTLYGIALMMQSFFLLFVFLPAFIAIHILYIKLIEEKELEKKFGQEYREYRRRVPMWLPRLKKTRNR